MLKALRPPPTAAAPRNTNPMTASVIFTASSLLWVLSEHARPLRPVFHRIFQLGST